MGSIVGKAMDDNMQKQQAFMLETQQVMVPIFPRLCFSAHKLASRQNGSLGVPKFVRARLGFFPALAPCELSLTISRISVDVGRKTFLGHKNTPEVGFVSH